MRQREKEKKEKENQRGIDRRNNKPLLIHKLGFSIPLCTEANQLNTES